MSFVFRTESEEGRSVEVVPTFIQPFKSKDILSLEGDGASALAMELEANDAIIDGKRQAGRTTLKANIAFHSPATIYSLVPGGWLPLPFTIPAQFLVDRNVIISLRKLREGKVVANAEALQWWAKFFSEGSGLFSPLPFAFEAGYRRKPTMAEFVSAYDEGVSELLNALPKCHVVKLEDAYYQAAYSQLEALDNRYKREVKFLQSICPLITERASRQKEGELAEFIVKTADKYHLDRGSFVTLAALSCLYEDLQGAPPSIGRQILKPKAVYSEDKAFNALSDLRHIELAAASQVYFGRKSFSLCTCDRALARFWSALSPRGISPSGEAIEFTFDLTVDLFSRLREDELLDLRQLLLA